MDNNQLITSIMSPQKLAKLYCKNHQYNYNQVRKHFLKTVCTPYGGYTNQFICEFWREVNNLIPS